MQAPAGEKEGEILRLRFAPFQHGAAGVVKGVVGLAVLRLPTPLYQQAAAAHLLGSLVEDHRGILTGLRRIGAEHGVV